MDMRQLKREELTLLALALAHGRPLTRIYLQKAVLIIQEALLEYSPDILEQPYAFENRMYGGWTADIYWDAMGYSKTGLVLVDDLQTDRLPFTYAATERG